MKIAATAGVLLLFAFSLGAFSLGRSQQRPTAALPDIFLVTIDTLRSDHVHCYGYDSIQTPALDSLAKDGILFSQAFTPSPITTSSHVSIMTGLLPSSHGVTDFGMPLVPQHTTLAGQLEKSGYQTAAFIGSIVLDSKTIAPGLDRGFQYYDNFPSSAKTASRWGRLERRAADVETRAEKWLEAHQGGGPRFLWVHFYDPHDPYEPPAPYSETYKQPLYDGEVAYADASLGRLLDRLKRQHSYDDALIIVLSDHGEGLGEHQENTHGLFLYDSTTHVPLLVKLPANRYAGKVVRPQVRTIDVMPTILDLLEQPVPGTLDGKSLRSLLYGVESEERPAIGETNYPLHFGWAPLRSVRRPEFKFIEAPRPEAYDLAADPGELQNRYEPWDPRVQQARQSLAGAAAGAGAPSASAVSRSTIDELRALGYFSAADARTTTQVPEPSLLPDPKDKVEEQNLIHTAMIAAEDGRVADARKALEEVLSKDEKSLAALLELGRMEMSAGNYRLAAEHLQRASALTPNHAELEFDLGRALYKSADLEGARKALEASIAADANQQEARLLLAQVYFDQKKDEAALDQVAASVIGSSDNRQTIRKAARLLLEHAKYQQAIELLEPSAGSDRDLLSLLAQAYKGAGRLNEAHKIELRLGRTPTKSP